MDATNTNEAVSTHLPAITDLNAAAVSEWANSTKPLIQRLKVARDVAAAERRRVDSLKEEWLADTCPFGADAKPLETLDDVEEDDVAFGCLMAFLDSRNREDGYELEPGYCPALVAEVEVRYVERELIRVVCDLASRIMQEEWDVPHLDIRRLIVDWAVKTVDRLAA